MSSPKQFSKIIFIFLIYIVVHVWSKTEYSAKEKEAIRQLRELLTLDVTAGRDDYFQRDHFLMRWLRARNMNVNAANIMAREAFKWRQDNNIDNVLNETVLEFSAPPYIFGNVDKEGGPVVLYTPTAIDLRTLILRGKGDKVVRTWIQMLQMGYHLARNVTLKNGEEATQVTAILDGHGFNFRQHFCVRCVPILVELLRVYETYYPDSLKYCVLINVNRFGVPFLEFMRPFLSEATQNSLKIFGNDRAEWSKFLLSIIPADQLTYRFGGTQK